MRWTSVVPVAVSVVMAAGAAKAEPLPVFDVDVTFASGDVLMGTVSLLTSSLNGAFAQSNLQLTHDGMPVTSFSDTEYTTLFLVPGFPPPQPTTTGMTFFSGSYPDQNAVQLILPTADLPAWAGGTVCLQGSGCSEGLYTSENVPRSQDGYPSTTVGVGPAVSGTFLLETPSAATPEPGALALLGTGLVAGVGALRWQRRPPGR